MTGSYPVPHTKAVALFQQQLQWKTAFALILWGFCLMMLQFQYFFEYAFLLPALGMVFTFLGFTVSKMKIRLYTAATPFR